MYKAGWYHHLGLRVVFLLPINSFTPFLALFVHPLLPLSSSLRKRGAEVTVCFQLFNFRTDPPPKWCSSSSLQHCTPPQRYTNTQKQINIFVLAEPLTHMLNWLHWTTGHVGRNIKCVLSFNTVVQSDLLDVFSHALACGSHSVQGLPVTAGTQPFLTSDIWKVPCLSVSNNQTSKYI